MVTAMASATTLTCQNCAAPLAIPADQSFVECGYCKTPHRVERPENGGVQLTMLQAAVEEIATDVKQVATTVRTVDNTTVQLLEIQRLMAQKDNAKRQLDTLKNEFDAT